jgi:hypothetical protein
MIYNYVQRYKLDDIHQPNIINWQGAIIITNLSQMQIYTQNKTHGMWRIFFLCAALARYTPNPWTYHRHAVNQHLKSRYHSN